ncbi:coiled-coil domain-containing protein 30 [Lampris incognitus]|uniref:coiled-coil domain-containing protein 30 n=1 Tax=Lampris incognitus TaxID=2546036 RepID=UPI0024B5044D|nr:coiled-coil domain-containing protein 30 [Lampris incognitus]
MEQTEEDLDLMANRLRKEGLSPDASTHDQLCFLWRALQHRENHLDSVVRDLDAQGIRHKEEMTKVLKSLKQIRDFTEQKEVLAEEVQKENERLREQVQQLISLQEENNASVQEVHKVNGHLREQLKELMSLQDDDDVLAHEVEMQEENDLLRNQLHCLLSIHDAQKKEMSELLRQQGLTEVSESSPSEQMAYVLAERAVLMEKKDGLEGPVGDGQALSASQLDAETHSLKDTVGQSPHRGATRHGQSPWKRLFGHRKAAQSKHTFIPTETKQLSSHPASMEKECARLERDLEEASHRLSMAHNEIRHLTDEVESARLSQRAYEPELQEAQQEVEQLRQEVENLKKREMVELRRAKEQNDRLDEEIRAIRNRVRSLDAERSSLKETVVSLQKEKVWLESVLQEQQEQVKKKLLTLQAQAEEDKKLAQAQAAELAQNNQTCRSLNEKFVVQTECLEEMETAVMSLQKEKVWLESLLQEQAKQQLLTVQAQADQDKALDEIKSLKQQLEKSQKDLDNLLATIAVQDQKVKKEREAGFHLEENSLEELQASNMTQTKVLQTAPVTQQLKGDSDDQDMAKRLLASQDECEKLKEEICDALKCLDQQRRKYLKLNEKYKARLHRAKQKFDDEIKWRDEKIDLLAREWSLSTHSSEQMKDQVTNMAAANDSLLCEKRELLEQLSKDEQQKKDSISAACLSKHRVDYLETENNALMDKTLQLTNQLAALERRLQKTQQLFSAEDVKKMVFPQNDFLTSNPVRTLVEMTPWSSNKRALLENLDSSHSNQSEASPSIVCALSIACSGPAEVGYLNLTSTQSCSDS